MNSLIPVIADHFTLLQDRLESFCRHGIQVESWFKGELLALFDRLKEAGTIRAFDREVKVDNGRIDFVIDLQSGRHWVELKQWLVGVQRGLRYGPADYFSDTQTGIVGDVAKLEKIPRGDYGWLLILFCSNPGPSAWQRGLKEFHDAFTPRRVRARSRPEDYPSTYFLGLLEVERYEGSNFRSQRPATRSAPSGG